MQFQITHDPGKDSNTESPGRPAAWRWTLSESREGTDYCLAESPPHPTIDQCLDGLREFVHLAPTASIAAPTRQPPAPANPLSNQAAHPLHVVLRELRYSRPAIAQHFLTWLADWLEHDKLDDTTLQKLQDKLEPQ
jgi:hypothetical protein